MALRAVVILALLCGVLAHSTCTCDYPSHTGVDPDGHTCSCDDGAISVAAWILLVLFLIGIAACVAALPCCMYYPAHPTAPVTNKL